MVHITTKEECEKLAKDNPREFLYQVYRDGPFATLDVCVPAEHIMKKVKRRWALDPSQDGLKTAFNIFAKRRQRSLYQQLVDYRQRTRDQFKESYEATSRWDGKPIPCERLAQHQVTPEALIRNIQEIIPLARAMLSRGVFDQEYEKARLADYCDLCENTIIPLLEKMPSKKSLADYPRP